ncbi:MAG TPA: hypothetical protein VJ782_02955 [Aeromicrobium sp.]|nr:hypothetical protein [Aeromicrobium sp.]
MKPGRRRLLIPGLLVALLIVVALAAALRRADAETTPLPIVAHTQVSVMSDPRIVESSGLAASKTHPGIVYTVNDSGDVARVFAVDIESGAVVGVTTVTNASWEDAEAMALWGGKLWVADVGTSRDKGDERAIYLFDEPGSGNHNISADRYPIELDVGAADIEPAAVEIEAMAVVPGRIDLFSKGWPQGRVFHVRRLTKSGPSVAQLTGRTSPAWTADATATPDGRYVLLKGAVQVEVRDARTWQLVHAEVIPMLRQSESITIEASGQSYLIGSEGADSPLVRIAFRPATFTTPPPTIDSGTQVRAQHPVMWWWWSSQWWLRPALMVAFPGLVLGWTVWWLMRRRRRKNQSEPT